MTPGPWTIRGGNSELPQVWDCGFDQCVTDRIFNGNAPLIAAAPDLLAACEAVIEECRATFVDTSEMSAEWRVIEEQLLSAIAKAQGRLTPAVSPER